MAEVIVGRAADLPPGERMIVEVEGRQVAVFNLGGEFFGVLNQCPHAGAPLCSHGRVSGIAEAASPVAELTYARRGEFITCPWHRWEYDIKTGESWFDPRNNRVRTYPVSVVEGEPGEVVDPDGGRQRGPYVIEGYEVSVDDDRMIVVDTSRRRAAVRASDAVTTATDVRCVG